MPDLDTLRRIGADIPIDDDAVARARATMLSAIDDDASSVSTATARPRGRRRNIRRFAVAAGLITALTAGGVVASTIGNDRPGESNPPVAAANAVVYLKQAAAASLHQQDPAPKPGQYRRIASTGLVTAGAAPTEGAQAPTWLARFSLTVWIPADRTQTWILQRTDNTPTKPLNPAGAAYLKANPQRTTSERLTAAGGTFYSGDGQASPWGEPRPGYYASLPSEPKALRESLSQQAVGNDSMSDEQLFETVRDALVTGMVPAKLRAAMYQILLSLPQVALTQESANLNGRKGVAVGIVRYGIREEIIFDPKTGQIIGTRSVVQSPSDLAIAPGTLIGSTAMTDEIVNGVR